MGRPAPSPTATMRTAPCSPTAIAPCGWTPLPPPSYFLDPSQSRVATTTGFAKAPIAESAQWHRPGFGVGDLRSRPRRSAPPSPSNSSSGPPAVSYIATVGERFGWLRIPPGSRKSTYEIPAYLQAAPFAPLVREAILNADYTKPERVAGSLRGSSVRRNSRISGHWHGSGTGNQRGAGRPRHGPAGAGVGASGSRTRAGRKIRPVTGEVASKPDPPPAHRATAGAVRRGASSCGWSCPWP